jgi:anti-anti-sigma factor
VTGATLHIDVAGDRERRVLVLSGELDLSTALQLDETLRAVCADGAEEVVLDLRGVHFMGSAGLRAIFGGRDLCAEHHCRYFLDPTLPPPLIKLFWLTKAGEHFAFKARQDGSATAPTLRRHSESPPTLRE